MKIVKEDERLCCKELDMLHLDAYLISLELKESYTLDRLHQEVNVLLTLKRRVELWEA